ncbi:MAG TPA: hypothetical protein VFV90_11570 [Usitatibacter sp.]|nr:hypothetical protein [Usitatibacter sp.]
MTAPELHTAASFVVQGKHSSVTELEYQTDHDEYFVTLKSGFLRWAGDLPPTEGHHISIFTHFRGPAEKQRAFAAAICERWNGDADLTRFEGIGVEVSIGTNARVSFGCTTFGDVVMKTGRVPMHVVDFGEVLERIKNEQEAQAEQERQRRRNNPVRRPALVPPWIRWDLASYLRLEFGESFWQWDSVKPWHLKYLGEYVIDGVPTRYWRYPTSDGKPRYATVERFEDSICLGMTEEDPPSTDPPPAPSQGRG